MHTSGIVSKILLWWGKMAKGCIERMANNTQGPWESGKRSDLVGGGGG